MEAPEATEARPEQADAQQDDTARPPDGSPLATPPTVAPPALGAHNEEEAELELQQLLLRIEALAPTLSHAALVMAAGRVGRLACSSPAQLAELFYPSGRLSFADDVQAMELDGTGRAPAPSEAGSLGSFAALECGACSDDEDGGGVGPLPFDDGLWRPEGALWEFEASPFALGELEAAAVEAAAANADLADATDAADDADAAVGTSAPAAAALAPWRRRDTIGLESSTWTGGVVVRFRCTWCNMFQLRSCMKKQCLVLCAVAVWHPLIFNTLRVRR